MDLDEDGSYFRFEVQKFNDVDSHMEGIYNYEILKKNNIEKINNDLFGLFPEFWEQERNNLNPIPEPEIEPEPEPIVTQPLAKTTER